jgi:hypothetical protein
MRQRKWKVQVFISESSKLLSSQPVRYNIVPIIERAAVIPQMMMILKNLSFKNFVHDLNSLFLSVLNFAPASVIPVSRITLQFLCQCSLVGLQYIPVSPRNK